MSKIIQDKARWDAEYQSGAWDCLERESELPRYALLASYIGRRSGPYRLLDVGCGEGLILRHLNGAHLESYTGVDLAQAALERIKPRRSQDRYICSTVEEFVPDTQWDVILLNEVLYYTMDPVAQIKKLLPALRKGGDLVISMYRKRNPFAWNNRCARQVDRHLRAGPYDIRDQVCLGRGPAKWQITVARPTRASVTVAYS